MADIPAPITQDSLTKPIETSFGLRYRGSKTRRDIAGERNLELKQKEVAVAERDIYKDLSLTDPMTGVGNERALKQFFDQDERRQQYKARERRGTGNLYPAFGLMIYLDADGLTQANKRGHEFGDELLAKVADAGKEIAHRPNDLIFRRGSEGADEFIIILPGENLDHMEQLEVRYLQALKSKSTDNEITASLAIGSYGLGRSARQTAEVLDKKLSVAKDKRAQKGMHVETIYLKENG
jgi:diguanylate cyclase (GGDEF)-like protein